MRWFGLFVFGIILLLPTSALAEEAPILKETACRFRVPEAADVTCVDLVVPENRNNPESLNIRLHAAIFHTSHANPEPDPIIFLDGGPGSSPLSSLPYSYEIIVEPFLANRDLIIIDQRGTGYAQPSLFCPEYNFSDEMANIFRCWGRLQDEGVDITAYNSAENAADIESLRLALGYEQWNLYGVSYGARLALTVMRDHPEGLRSVVLDGVYPPEVNLYLEYPHNLDRAFQQLFNACAESTACNEAYPDLKAVFREQVTLLAEEPATLALDNHPDIPITAYDFVNTIFGALYTSEGVRYIPQTIYAAKDGDYNILWELQGLQRADAPPFSHAMYYAIQCMDEMSFTDYTDWEAAANEFNYLAPFLQTNVVYGKPIFEICAHLDHPPVDSNENAPVLSDVPTLITTGQFDPITPPAWGKLVGLSLPNSFNYVFPGLGHGTFPSHPCPQDMVLDFYDNPTVAPKDLCMDQMRPPRFALP